MNNNFQTFIMSNLLFILYLPNDQRVPRVMQLSYKFFPQLSFHTRNVTLFLGLWWKQNPLCLASSLHSHPKVNNHYSAVQYMCSIFIQCVWKIINTFTFYFYLYFLRILKLSVYDFYYFFLYIFRSGGKSLLFCSQIQLSKACSSSRDDKRRKAFKRGKGSDILSPKYPHI